MGQEFASLTSWLLSVNCRVAVQLQMYHHEFRVLYKLIFIAFDWFNHLLIAQNTLLVMYCCPDYCLSAWVMPVHYWLDC